VLPRVREAVGCVGSYPLFIFVTLLHLPLPSLSLTHTNTFTPFLFSPTFLADSAPTDARGFKDINDTFFQYVVKAYELAFEGQFHYACFYSYVKLKEQEVKNIAWLATCMEHGVYSEMERIVPIFSKAPRR
jgi:hypothetical protein